MNKTRTCFFTGHRRLAADKTDTIKEKLLEYIEKLIIEYDVRDFISGGALGFDQLAAQAVIEMRESYPHIRLLMYLPCYGQSKKWDVKKKYSYKMILSKADENLYVTDSEYRDGCMRERNMRMIKDAYFCIAYCTVYRSGTGATLSTARKEGIKIINIADEIKNSDGI